MKERMSISQASEILGLSGAFIRYQMDVGGMDLGVVTKTKSGRRTHIIFRSKLEKLIGRKIEEGEK